jgi:hypothetical protein
MRVLFSGIYVTLTSHLYVSCDWFRRRTFFFSTGKHIENCRTVIAISIYTSKMSSALRPVTPRWKRKLSIIPTVNVHSLRRVYRLCEVVVRNTTKKCIHRYVNLLYHKHRSLLRVSATYCGHLQGGVLWKIYYIERRNNLLDKYKLVSLNKILISVLKYKIMIKLYVLSCLLICCVYGDTILK